VKLAFHGESELLRSRGVQVEILDDAECIGLMQEFQQKYPELRTEEFGETAE